MTGTIKEKGGGLMALNDNLKDARNRIGMSQELVAERLGISRQAVTKWELGQSKPSAKNLQALAELYQVSSDELLADKQRKTPNLILRTNLTKWAIILQTAFLFSCTQEIFQLRHPDYPDKAFYRGALTFSLTLLVFASIWMTANHRYEPNKDQRRKNVHIELLYCCVQTIMALLIIYFGMGLVGLMLMISICLVYILYINPKFMNRKFTR